MIHKIHGELIVDDYGMVTCRFERVLPYPAARVWRHLVDRRHLHEWLTSEPGGFIRPRAGSPVHLPTIGGAVIRGEVIDYEAERYLAIGWESADWLGGIVEWTLTPQEGETALAFQHSDERMGSSQATRTLANWHLALDMFEESLAGRPRTWNRDAWQEYFLHYVRTLPHAELQ
ncbi:MAG: SRPBCC domain-containing protein [Chloroflexia bacterium]|nr:SRPBCC domain-containing protein [Chloroflexia bacterium]